MKQISHAARYAFINEEKFSMSNTSVVVSDKETKLYLHGNLIASKLNGERKFTIRNAGWFSNTTKERLNALPNVRINQIDFTWFLNGEVWDGKAKEISF